MCYIFVFFLLYVQLQRFTFTYIMAKCFYTLRLMKLITFRVFFTATHSILRYIMTTHVNYINYIPSINNNTLYLYTIHRKDISL